MGKRKLLENWWKDLDKNWVKLYQNIQISRKSYIEQISRLIFNHYKELKLPKDTIRTTKSFNTHIHNGSANIKKGIGKKGEINFNEKRFCRALYNLNQEKDVGIIFPKTILIDYQVPLREKRGQNYGEIDLLAKNKKEKSLWIIELKAYYSNESLLKAILEVFTYVRLINLVKDKFLEDFGCHGYSFIPVVFTFVSSTSGIQLQEMKDCKKFEKLKALIEKLNLENKKDSIGDMKFFIINGEWNKKKPMKLLLYRNKKVVFNKNGEEIFKNKQNKCIFKEVKWWD